MILTHTVKKPAGFVFNCLCDTEIFITLHPAIYKMTCLANRQYRVFEKLKYGFITWPFTYTATIKIYRSSMIVIMTATVLNSITIEMIFVIEESDAHSVIKEKINFKNAWPVKPFIQKIFRQQHLQLFKNIEKHH